MRALLFFYPANGAAAKAFAAPLRHRRHKVQLRDIGAWMMNREIEDCDTVIIMLSDDEIVPGELIEAYGKREPTPPEIQNVRPGDEPWQPTEAEALAMNELNRLRERAALLGIEVDPAYDHARLAELIGEKEKEAAERAALEDEAARRAEREAEDARLAREGAAAGSTSTAAATEAGGAAGEGSATQPATPDAEAIANADALVELAGINRENADDLRAFARKHGIPVSPNQKTGADKILAAIRVKLGA